MSTLVRTLVRTLVSRRRALSRTICVVLLGGATSVADAHEIHTTHTTVKADATGYVLTIRAFADDLSASVARAAGKPVPADSSVVTSDLLSYVTSRLTVTDAGGKALSLQSCGVERRQDTYLVCVRIAAAVATSTLQMGNQMLAELHSDQVNIVQCELGDTRRTHLFTRGRSPTMMASRGRCAET